jgi:hypothetical protein
MKNLNLVRLVVLDIFFFLRIVVWIGGDIPAMINPFALLEDMPARFSATVFTIFDCLFALE